MGGSQRQSQQVLTAGARLIQRLERRAFAEMRSRIDQRTASSGCVGLFGGGLVIMFALALIDYIFDSAIDPGSTNLWFYGSHLGNIVTTVVVIGGSISLGFLGALSASRSERSLVRRELASYMPHFHHVLFDKGLFAIVLSGELLADIPGLGRVAGIPGTDVMRRKGLAGDGSLEQRVQLLTDYYALLCYHFRLQPLPRTYSHSGLSFKLKGPLLHAFNLALVEGVADRKCDLRWLD